MENTSFPCPNPNCNVVLELPSENIGQKYKCPKCNQYGIVPTPIQIPVKVKPEEKASHNGGKTLSKSNNSCTKAPPKIFYTWVIIGIAVTTVVAIVIFVAILLFATPKGASLLAEKTFKELCKNSEVKTSSGYEVKYWFEKGDLDLARLKADVKRAELSLEKIKHEKRDLREGTLQIYERILEQARQKYNQQEPLLLMQKNKWLLWVELTTKNTGKLLSVSLFAKDGKRITTSGMLLQGEEIIGDTNTYRALPYEIEDLGNDKFKISLDSPLASPILVKLENGILVLDVGCSTYPPDPPKAFYETTIKLPPQSN